jgi:2-polyprenyl-6-methoxyphenol hydroxylase-like FAD-dependent oxidoreductase
MDMPSCGPAKWQSETGGPAVVIIGGGPCGLILAIELGRRGVSTIVLEEKSAPSRFPSANATQARTMEHYRRLGFVEKVRARGLPQDYPTDIAYFSRYTKRDLACQQRGRRAKW